MRFGVLISIVSHVVFVALALLGTPKLFDEAATRPIEVELVRSEDAPPEQPEEKPLEKQEDSKTETAKEPGKPEKDKPAPWNPLPDQTVASPPPKPDPATKPDPAAKPNDQQAAAQTQQPQQPRGPGQSSQPQPAQPQDSQPAQSSIFDPVNIPKLLNLPNAPDSGFDSESMTAANISEDQKAAFKAHLRKCWKLPGAVSSPTTRVVMRVYFRRDGTLASEPVLIEASASRDGPVVMQTAIRALKECQPFGFLPADKYREWKVLDLSFTPRDMAGG
jgi:hypothetical protein